MSVLPLASLASAPCIHCGAAFRPSRVEEQFCCAGCQFVYGLINKNGLGRFYELQNAALSPVKPFVFQKRNYAWLEALAGDAGNPATLTLDIQGLSCIGCVWLIEKLFHRRKGALSIAVDSTLGRARMSWQPGVFDSVAFARELQSFGYLLGAPGKTRGQNGAHALVRRLGLCGAFAMNALLFTLPAYTGLSADSPLNPLFRKLAFLFATLSFATGGSYFIRRAWQGARKRVLHIDLPISLGLIAAYGASILAWHAGDSRFCYFDFVSTFTFLMLVGRWVQLAAIDANRNRLLALQPAIQKPARGDFYTLEPGEMAPVRSRLCSCAASFGMEWITGEPEARMACQQQMIPSGAVNLTQEEVRMEALEAWEDSILSKLLAIHPRGNGATHPALQSFIRRYVAVAIGIAVAGFCAWFHASGDVLRAFQVFTSVLVVSCPCAAGLALPMADELAAAGMRRKGVFVREGGLWSRLQVVRKIVFDKTGTLTLETMSLRNREPFDALDAAEKSVLLAMVRDNLHPVACCLRELLLAGGAEPVAASSPPREVVGQGIELDSGWRLGRPSWAAPDCPRAADECLFARSGKVLAAFSFIESVRADAAQEIARLRQDGCEVFILSGDRSEKVAGIAAQLGLDPGRCHGELSPEQKAGWIRRIDAHDTLMIGDGANDSLAFDAAHCSGTPAVDRGLLENKADFYFLGRGIDGVRALLDAARARRRCGRLVVAFAIVYNVLAVALALAGKMTPLAAAILMPLSSLASLGIVFAAARLRAH